MADTFTTLWHRLQLRASAIDAALCQEFIRDGFNQIAERREWSWLRGHGAFSGPIYTNLTDQATIAAGSLTVNTSGGFLIPAMVGQQIRIGGFLYPTYTITSYISPSQVQIDAPWVGPTITSGYQVFQCYFPVPSDFSNFISIVNPAANYRLWTDITQSRLDQMDAQRVQSQLPYAAVFYDYTYNYQGTVQPTLSVQSSGTGTPISTTSYGFSYPVNSVFSVKIISTGQPGTASFQWKQDAGPWSPTIVIVDSNTVYDLSNGVQAYFPAGTYNSGDLFIIQCTANSTSGVPRYELWPRPINSPYTFPYLYRKVLPPLTDDQPQLPGMMAQRGDVILEKALACCARWPGTDTMRNPYYDLELSHMHDINAERLINEMEMKDDDLAPKDLMYSTFDYFQAPWMDGSWLQSHAIYPYA